MEQKNMVAIHQPNFLPWLGYFHKMVHSDVFILFDDVQLPRGKSFGNRVLIKTNQGPAWLTVPVKGKGDLPLFNEATINREAGFSKIIRTIKVNYSKAAFFDQIFPGLEDILSKEHDLLFALNRELIRFVSGLMQLETKIMASSELDSGSRDDTLEKIINLLVSVNAGRYISGKGEGSKRYLDESLFRKKGIELMWQEFDHPQYPQLYGEFVPNLSVIDALFNIGPEETRNLLSKVRISSP